MHTISYQKTVQTQYAGAHLAAAVELDADDDDDDEVATGKLSNGW